MAKDNIVNKTKGENESNKENVSVENKDNFIVQYIKNYATEKPKKTFLIMFLLLALSVVVSVSSYFYNKNIAQPKFKEKISSINYGKDAKNSIENANASVTDLIEIKKVLNELDYYKTKEVLTKQDSIRIKFLIDKYQSKKK